MAAQYEQNPHILEDLKHNFPLKLLHANKYDEEWGTGVSLFDKEVLTKTGPGGNLHGKILTEIRDGGILNPEANPNPLGFIGLPRPLKCDF